MENDTPDASVHTQATPIATTPLNAAAIGTANTSGMVVCSSRLPQAYAPRPYAAAWPKDSSRV